MEYLCLRARNGSKDWCNQWNHDVVDEVCLDLAVGEVHALCEACIVHLFLARLYTYSVKSLVQRKIKCNFHETGSAQNVANGEDPIDVVGVGSAFGHPDIESRGNQKDCHLDGQEMRLKKSMEKNEETCVIGSLQSVGDDIGEDSALRCKLQVDTVNLDIRNIGIWSVIATSN